MNTAKYIHKEMIQVNEDLRIYKYFYKSGIAIYITPRSEDVEVIKIWVGMHEINTVFNKAGLELKVS